MGKPSNATVPLLQHHTTKPSKGGIPADQLSPTKYKEPIKHSPTVASSPSGSYTTTSSATSSTPRARLASAELIVPAVENVNSVYYGVDAFSPTLVDFYTVDQKRIIWSSRAHRKMMTTLYAAWHQQPWKRFCIGYWSNCFLISAYCCFLVGVFFEILHHTAPPTSIHLLVDIPLLVGTITLLFSHVLGYFEVINSCHNLELWLDEYFHGCEPVLERRYLGWFPSRIDFWSATMGMIGSVLYCIARVFILFNTTQEDTIQYGIISINRSQSSLIIGYWIPFFFGSFALLLSAYLGHVEVVHRWFSWRLDRLETWVTGLYMLSTLGLFISSTLQFMDPMDVLFTFTACITPFIVGCIVGICSGILGLFELETIHQRHKHPEYGLLKNLSGYGSTWT